MRSSHNTSMFPEDTLEYQLWMSQYTDELILQRVYVTHLPYIPPNVRVLDCSFQPLTSLPSLPPRLTHLHCVNTAIKELPELPEYLEVLILNSTPLTKFPRLPPHLNILECEDIYDSLPRKKNERMADYIQRWNAYLAK